jgi:ribosome-binding factor A
MGNDDRTRGRKRQHRPEPDEGARAWRLQQIVREEVNLLLRSEVRDPRLDDVVITMVELAGECARLWFSAADAAQARAALEGAAGFLRTRLAESLGLKRTPDLRFRADPATRARLE